MVVPDRYFVPGSIIPAGEYTGKITRPIEMDEIYRDHDTLTYRSRYQDAQIEELRKQIVDKDVKKKQDLQNIIAYFYTR